MTAKQITVKEALEALGNMDDYAKMNVSIDPKGARKILTDFILQVANERSQTEGDNRLIPKDLAKDSTVKDIKP